MSTLETTANDATHMFTDNTLVQKYIASLSGLNKQQALIALSTKNLSNAQKEQILSKAGLIASENAIQSELLQTTLIRR